MSSARQIAGMIASVTQSTMYLNPVWDALSEEAKQQLMERWAALITSDATTASDAIVEDIKQHPALGPAWQKLEERGANSTHRVYALLIAEYQPGE